MGRNDDASRLIVMASGVAKLPPDFAPKTVSSTDLNSVNQKIDLLMTMTNDIAPVVKTLNKAYEDSLLTESDEDIDVNLPVNKQNWQRIQLGLKYLWESWTPLCLR